MEAHHKEIDLFEFAEIVVKRKYLILSMVLTALIAALFYCYLLREAAPKRYSIQMRFQYLNMQITEAADTFRDLNQMLSALKSQVVGTTVQWFENRMYKASLQEQLEGVHLPDIEAKHKGDFFTIGMNARDPEAGKEILQDTFDIFMSSGVYVNFKNDMNKLFHETLEKKKIALADTQSQIGVRKDLLTENRMEIDAVDNKIKRLRAMLREVEEKGAAADPSTNLLPRLNLQYAYETTLRDFIGTLERRLVQLTPLMRWINDEVTHLENKSALQQVEIATLTQAMDKTDRFIDVKKPYYEALPLDRRYSNIRIIGFSMVLAAFFGILIAFVLGINERRRQQAINT